MFFVCLLGTGGGLLILYLVLRLNSLWIYGLFDRATRNSRTSLSHSYEVPRYFRLGVDGQIDTAIRWPGWDGWYFFVVPDDGGLPIKMIRASVMTGLYGLSGVDDYSLLPADISQYHAGEHLVLVPAEGGLTGEPGSHSRQNYLSHVYAPKTGLRMNTSDLCVQLTCPGSGPGAPISYGSVEGKWPDYRFHFCAPEYGLEIELAYRGQKLVWWADVRGVFTYFCAFGRFSGKATLARSAAEGGTVKYQIEGPGGFEHGFARKPFTFDLLYAPVRGIQSLFPSFRPVRYHYEVLIGEGDLCGGWMRACGFGIDIRNRGGLHLDGEYVPIQSTEVEYLDPSEKPSVSGSARSSTTFYRRWRVRAHTAEGPLEYIATHDWPPAPVATNMTYYNHSFEGTFRGRKIRGKGYGEYLHI
jgi:hypothetical protein